MREEISEIKDIIQEEIEVEYYTKRNEINQYKIITIDREKVPENYLVLISLDKKGPQAFYRREPGSKLPEELPTYFGKIELFKCTKKTGLFGKEKLNVEKSYKKLYSKEEWVKDYKRLSIRYVLEMK